ncbi:Uncharacterised protein [Mycobacterium tuberculosis]|nr:Uncharacterised protein [Mycobacterium tuberculosis]
MSRKTIITDACEGSSIEVHRPSTRRVNASMAIENQGLPIRSTPLSRRQNMSLCR